MLKKQIKNEGRLKWRKYSRSVIEEAFVQYLQQEDTSYFRAFNPKELFLDILDKKQDKENHKYLTLKKNLNKIK